MAKKYLGKEETARAVSKLIEKEYTTLINDNLCDEATLQSIITALGSPEDTGGDVGTGSIFARLNAISSLAGSGGVKQFKAPISIREVHSKTTINGKGTIFISRALENITIDGVRLNNTSLEDSGGIIDCPFYINFYSSVVLDLECTVALY